MIAPHAAPPFVLLLLAACAAIVSALLVRMMIRIAVLDHPVERSSHTRPTPKGGGVGIIAAFAIGVCLFAGGTGVRMLAIPAAVVALSGLSWMDDVRQWPAWVKLVAQALAALVVAWACVGPAPVPMVIAWVWLVYLTNALNFIDGLNGLASGTMFIAAAVLAWICGAGGPVAVEAAALCGGIAGFLPFNFPRARIFMGDVGSQGAALAVGAMGLQVANTAVPNTALLCAPAILCAVCYDVGFTLLRRACAGSALMQAHRGHLYQLAQRSGVPASVVAALYWAFALWGAGCALHIARTTSLAGAALWVLVAAAPMLAWTGFVCRLARNRLTTAW